jgi:hypothetical protein
MMRRTAMRGALIAVGVLAPLVALVALATPASAGNVTGACTGSDCSVSLDKFIHYGGSAFHPGAGGGNAIAITEDPPPCLWDVIGDQVTGSNYLVQLFPNPAPDLPFGIAASVKQAQDLLKNPTPGTWYNLPINPATDEAGVQACLKLPAYFFAPPGTTPPMPNIPPRILAEYAYNHMRLPVPQVTTSPATKGWVNLASFVWTNLPRQAQTITATLGDESVTLTATPRPASITAGSAGAAFSNCGPGGSHHSQAHPPATGPGTAPDCGVLWRNATAGATISATVTWDVTYAPDPDNGTLPAIPLTGTSQPLAISEIQSVNGG